MLNLDTSALLKLYSRKSTALMKRFLQLTAETPRLGCRTMDIFHVACALEIGAATFLSFDQRQNTLAGHAGLKLADHF